MAVTIEFGGQSRELFFGLKEIKELEAQLGGIPVGAVMGQLAQIGITAITAALYVGLKGEDKTLNPNLVTKMLDDYIRPTSAGGQGKRIKVIADALSEALDETGLFKGADDPETPEDGEGNAPSRRRSRSGSSGRNPSASASSDSPRLSSGD